MYSVLVVYTVEREENMLAPKYLTLHLLFSRFNIYSKAAEDGIFMTYIQENIVSRVSLIYVTGYKHFGPGEKYPWLQILSEVTASYQSAMTFLVKGCNKLNKPLTELAYAYCGC